MPEENKHRLGAAKTLLTLSHWEALRGIVLLCFVYAFFYLCVFWKPQTLLWKIHILALYRLLNSVQPTQQYINFCHMIWFFSYGLHGKKRCWNCSSCCLMFRFIISMFACKWGKGKSSHELLASSGNLVLVQSWTVAVGNHSVSKGRIILILSRSSGEAFQHHYNNFCISGGSELL